MADQPLDPRAAEHAEIAARFEAGLAARGQRSNFSPSYINSRPPTLAQKLKVTPEEEEQILFIYASTYSIQQTASTVGVTHDKVRSVVYNPEMHETIQGIRDGMKISVLQKIEESQIVLLDAIQDPDKLKNASITQLSEVFTEISGTQANLISTLRESHDPVADMDAGQVFSGEELEYMMLLRRRLAIGGSPNEAAADQFDGSDVYETDGGPVPEEALDLEPETHVFETVGELYDVLSQPPESEPVVSPTPDVV